MDDGIAQHQNMRQQRSLPRWTDKQLNSAMNLVESGVAISAVARHFDIPRSSLADYVEGRTRTRKRGPPTILNNNEERALESYMLSMVEYGHPLTIEQVRMKVALITQERPTPFTNGIPRHGWLRWFKKRHRNLTIRQSQGLEFSRAKGLNAKTVQGFYHNLEKLYEKYRYPPDNIWNCDESGAQASKSGGGRVWAQKRSRSMHTLIPNEREHITTLTCIDAASSYISNFYIFKGKRIRDNYILHCENGAAMAMQSAAWMTQVLFSS